MIAKRSPARRSDKIDVQTERLIPLKNTTAIGCSQSPSTLKRWQRVGIVSHVNGQRIYLAVAYDGRIRCTTREAYLRFLVAYNAPAKRRRA